VCARGLRPPTGHGFVGAHHVLARARLALSLITERSRLADGKPARVAAVIWSPNLGVLAVSVAGVLCAFCWVLDTLPGQCLRRRPVRIPLSLMLFELSGYYVNTVQLHVHAADLLVRRGMHSKGSR
jgi:hypothetical protein